MGQFPGCILSLDEIWKHHRIFQMDVNSYKNMLCPRVVRELFFQKGRDVAIGQTNAFPG